MTSMQMPVTVVVSRRTERPRGKELLQWAERLCDAASTFAGFLGSRVHSSPTDEFLEVVIGLSFADVRSFLAWEESTERAECLRTGASLTEGPPTALSIESLDGQLWGSDTPAPTTLPRWVSALVVWIGLFPPALLLNLVLDPLLTGWPAPLRTLLTTLILVPLVVFVTVPLLQSGIRKLTVADRRESAKQDPGNPRQHHSGTDDGGDSNPLGAP